jgi:RND superfamily putative drug exporter
VLERWTRWVIRFRLAVVSCWLVLLVLGLLATPRLSALLTTSLAVPSTGSAQANTILIAHFGDNVEGSYTVVYLVRGPSAAEVNLLERRTAVAARVVPGATVSAFHAGPDLVVGTIESPLGLQQAASRVDALRAALRAPGLPRSYVTGPPAIQRDLAPLLTADLHRGELVAVLVAIALMVLLLGLSAAVAVPFGVAAATTFATLAILYAIAHEVLLVLYVPNVIALIGFGLAVDYSLLIVCRFREELSSGAGTVDEAIVATMASAGRTVVRSGVAVALGLCVLLLVPVPFLQSLGIAGLVVPLVSIAAALTLQPALLRILGRRCDRAPGARWRRGAAARTGGVWAGIAAVVVRRPVLVLGATSIVLASAASSLAWLELTPASVTAIPQGVASTKGLDLLRARIGPGAVAPIDVVLDAGTSGAIRSRSVQAATNRLIDSLGQDPEIAVVVIGSRPPYVDPTGRYSQILVIGRHDFGDEQTQALVARITGRDVAAAGFPSTARVFVGGAPAQGVDFLDRVYGALPWVVLCALALAYVLLLRAFRSLLLPLLAVVLDVVTIAAAQGMVVLVFRFGVGAGLLGVYRVSQVEGWVPVFLFAMLFGLSMDYEVFFVSRMRESFDAGSDTAGAVTDGLVHTGRVVSVAALVMVGALLGLVGGRIAGLQELGVGLAFGVLLDATVVRGLLLPSVLVLLGRWSWWLPDRVASLARVTPSPLCERGEGVTASVVAGS